MGAESAYLRHLAEDIGPRPATTDAEARAADYIQAVFTARGMEVERQEFECPRTYSWAYVGYHLLAILAAVGSYFLPIPAAVLGVLTAVLMWLDLDTRWGLSNLSPKGPSQNVIARHVPKARRGERLRKVVIVAHYDSAKSSLAFSPSMVRRFEATFGLMKGCTWLVALLAVVAAVPATGKLQPWLWYATLAAAAYLVVPLVIAVHRELFMHATPGANDNASGVAAMFGVMERIVPEPDEPVVAVPPVLRGEEEAWLEDVVPDDAVLTYTPANAPEPLLDAELADDAWGDAPPQPSAAQGSLDFPEPAAPAEDPHAKGDASGRKSLREWLGVGNGFDARVEGRKIGSWDQFAEEEDADDDWGLKGGTAVAESFEDPDFAAAAAARIRRKVTQRADREIAEKEVWFVATGAEEAGTWGMRAFLGQYGAELRDALIINLDNLGSGNLSWVTHEGMATRYQSDRRLRGCARRVALELELPVKGRPYRGLSTDATPALARGFRAMSVMAFDINGRLPHWHWRTDTIDNVAEENLVRAADLVAGMLKEL